MTSIREGIEKGKLEIRLEATFNAHASGPGIPLITRIVDLPVYEVRRILKEQGRDIGEYTTTSNPGPASCKSNFQ